MGREGGEQGVVGGGGQDAELGPARVHVARVGHRATRGDGEQLRAEAHPQDGDALLERLLSRATSAMRKGSCATRVALWRPPRVTTPAISSTAGSASASPGLRAMTAHPAASSASRTMPSWRSGRWVMIRVGFTRPQDRCGPTCHAVAMLRWLMAVLAIVTGAVGTHPAAVAASTSTKPHIVWDPIPFGATRKAEMTAYVRRHYGSFMKPTWRLVDPHVIVIHYTDASYSSTFNTFAHDVPDSELHELPNTCAHFVIDAGGVIHQLVSLQIMCRHTVGLNWTAIGIEHVGFSDAQVLDDARADAASLRLVHWLRAATISRSAT